MRPIWIVLTLATAVSHAPAKADDGTDIRRLEAAWAQAFLANDYESIERIVAPEYKLMRVDAGQSQFTDRENWFRNSRRLTFHEYEVKVTDVTVSGSTAVATIEGRWKISRSDRGTRDERFVLSDTLVKRKGRWIVIFRHSSPIQR